MSLAQIQKFLDESTQLHWKWEYIGLLGGEPTLHPQLLDIIRLLANYKSTQPNVTIELATNGYGTAVHNILNKVPTWVMIRNSKKMGRVQTFSTYNVAPVDLPAYGAADFSTGCWITENCGIALTRYGFYPCGAGGSADRILGLDLGVKYLGDVTLARMTHLLSTFCRVCGHFKDFDLSESDPTREWQSYPTMSDTWKDAYMRYLHTPPPLSLY